MLLEVNIIHFIPAVSSKARGLGLGKKLVRRSIEIGRENNCEFYFSLLTGIYSQKIYRDLGFSSMLELKYDEHKDKYGNLVVCDGREHKSAITMNLKLK